MEEIKSTDILKFNENQVSEVRKALGYADVNKLKQDIEHLDDWIKKQNHFRVKEFDRGFLERLLIYNKGSVERAKQKLDKLFTCTNLMPDFLQNFDIKNEFVHLFCVSNVCVLPKPTKENYRVLVTYLTGKEDPKFYLIHYYRFLLALGHYMLNNDYCHGYEMITDLRKMTLYNIGLMNPIVIRNGLTLMIDAMGQRVKRIHVLSGFKLFDTAILLFKQGLSAKLKERLIVHPNIKSLHDYVPKQILPVEYEGDEVSVKELCDANLKELSSDSNIAKVKLMESASTDESRRLVCKFNEEYSGMPGSFKTLCVD